MFQEKFKEILPKKTWKAHILYLKVSVCPWFARYYVLPKSVKGYRPNYDSSHVNITKYSNIKKLTNKSQWKQEIPFYIKEQIFYSYLFPTWVWPVEFRKIKILNFWSLLTKADKKIDPENFRIFVYVV